VVEKTTENWMTWVCRHYTKSCVYDMLRSSWIESTQLLLGSTLPNAEKQISACSVVFYVYISFLTCSL